MPVSLDSIHAEASVVVKRFLDRDKSGALYRRFELERAIKIPSRTVSTTKEKLSGYWILASALDENGQHKLQTLWANPKVIAKAKEMTTG